MSDDDFDLFDAADAREAGNAPEFSVSELSGAIRRALEQGFGRVRVKGEIGRVSTPRSGHVYLDLKDDKAVLASVIWKGVAARLELQPREGDEVIAEGRITTYGGQSKYQLIIDRLSHAGEGALLAKLERLKRALAAEGLFAPEKKRKLPVPPRILGVVTSPSGAVIRDMLHRVEERWPLRVLVWPVAVQGANCAPQVARAIAGFNALPPDGPVPRPDVIVVARGGGSVEDLWGFNDEAVVRAAAASAIPLVSAVGHETDWTLLDHAADARAPTPTAAAEMLTPVRADLAAALAQLEARRLAGFARLFGEKRRRLGEVGRLLPRPERLLEQPAQALDSAGLRLDAALSARLHAAQARFQALAAQAEPWRLERLAAQKQARLDASAARLAPALERAAARESARLEAVSARLGPVLERRAARGALALERLGGRLRPAALITRSDRSAERLAALGRMLESLSYRGALARGYAVVRDAASDRPLRRAAQAQGAVTLEFADGRKQAVIDP